MYEIDSEKFVICSNLQFIGSEITSFDVSENDIIAVAFTNNHISILNGSGEFLEDYAVITDGAFVLEWEGEYLFIYLEKV